MMELVLILRVICDNLKGCPPHHYLDENDDCSECDVSCGGCYGPGVSDCDWCEEGKYDYYGECLTCEENEYFEWDDGVCKSCEEFGCSLCHHKDNCESCLDTYLLYEYKCYPSGECPLGTEENSEGTECYRNVSTFEVYVWDEEEDSDTFRFMFDIRFDEEEVEDKSYIEFIFPPSAVFEEGVSSCQERDGGDSLVFVSFLNEIALYEIHNEFYIGDVFYAECTQLTKVQNKSSIL